jgi:hypothetical protein
MTIRVPEYEPEVRERPIFQQGVDVRASPDAFGAGIGRGMQALAQGVGNFADAMQRVKALEDETIARNARNDFMRRSDDLYYGDDGYGRSTGKGAIDGFDGYTRRLAELKKEVASRLTPSQQSLFLESADQIETQSRRSAIIHRGDETKRFVIESHQAGAEGFLEQAIRKRADQGASRMYLDAGRLELRKLGQLQGSAPELIAQKEAEFVSQYHSQVAMNLASEDAIAALDYVEKNQAEMTPEAALRLLDQLARPAGEAAARDALAVQGTPAIDAVVDRIVGAESGGNANAQNPDSTAGGLGQFIDSTWLNMIRKYRPDLAAGKSAGEVLALKYDPTLNREMTRRYTEENAGELRAAGIPVTIGNLYLAHFLGPGGAKTVLRAGDGASLENLLSPGVVAANGFLRGHDVAWLKGWASKKMGGAPIGDVKFSERTERAISTLPGEMQVRVREIADNGFRDVETQTVARMKVEQVAAVDAYRLRIETGDTSLTSQDILRDAIIDDGDKASLISRLNEKRGGEVQAAEDVLAYNAGAFRIDPYSGDGRKRAEGVWSGITRTIGPDQDARPIVESFVGQTGYVPAQIANGLRGALVSGHPGRMAQALSLADAIARASPQAFDQMADSGKMGETLELFRVLTNQRGMTADEAARSILQSNSVERKATREQLKSAATAWVKDLTVDDVTDAFDESWIGGGPGPGSTIMEVNALTAEWKALAEAAFYETGGDPDAAKAKAMARIKRSWGVSSVTGSPQLMRLPPERFYPPVDGEYEYIREDALKTAQDYVAVHFSGEEARTVDNIALVPDAQTVRDREAGRPPRYRLFYSYTQDGVNMVDEVTDGLWGMTAEEIQRVEGKASANRKADFGRARAKAERAIRIEEEARAAGEATIGPDWMKAQAEAAVRERARMSEGDLASKGDRVAPLEIDPKRFGRDGETP